MLKVTNVYKDYGNGKGVENISFQIAKGKICGILGNNGCGKTTTFRLLLSLLQADNGEMTYDGEPISKEEFRRFGYVPEERSMLRNLSVKEQVFYLAKLKNMKLLDIQESYDYWLDYLQLRQYNNSKIIELSKGNQQKVQFLCALIHYPDIIIFDEPLNGLDVNNVQLFKKLLMKLREEKKIVLISSHQYYNIEHYCDQIVYLQDGKVIFKGDIERIKKKKEERIIKYKSKKDLFMKEEGIISTHREKDFVYVHLENKEYAHNFILKLIEKGIDEYAQELVSLHDIIKEKTK